MDYDKYAHLTCTLDDLGILTVIIDRPEKKNALTAEMHEQLSHLWAAVSEDPEVKVALITGRGDAFSVGGDLSLGDATRNGGVDGILTMMHHARRLVYSMPACRKPIISAINGYALGAGLAIALMADISIASDEARLCDGHTRLGVAAGDHANLIWPLHMSFARAKYYLLTSEFMTGRQAAEFGLVSKSVPAEQLLPEARRVAEHLARGNLRSIELTKLAANQWLESATPNFELSLALEFIGVQGEDGARISNGPQGLVGR